MADRFQNNLAGLSSPIEYADEVTPGAGALPEVTRALWIGTGGDVTLTTKGGNTVTFANVPDGTLLPVRATHVTAATASDILALS